MLTIADLINDIHKDVELERQGMTRIRRWTGDTRQVTGNRKFQASAYKIQNTNSNLDEIGHMKEIQPRREAFNSILTRFSNLLTTPHNSVGNKS
jgi:hypothetical protein